ncbi:M36 family metallopeptidase [Roseateles saccharophilus]|uniref:PA domain-containing protein n=2 Tax=Roseateles saccharophilus TaxID=304 RepID=A0A4R3UJQ0_ROSSA|nr:M36 family metallopeptidase [Roseateles saccharophilus]TCU91855.1 PA domain-containing protein [Roseateles saccharophilus]
MIGYRTRLSLAFTVFGVAAGAAMAAPALQERPPQILRPDVSGPLGNTNNGGTLPTLSSALLSHGHAQGSLGSLQQTEERHGRGGVTHVVYQQSSSDGLAVYKAYVRAAIGADGTVLQIIDHLANVPGGPSKASTINATQALQIAATQLYPGVALQFTATTSQGATSSFDGGTFFYQQPRVTAVAVPMADGSLAQGWLVETWADSTNQLLNTLVGGDGTLLQQISRTASDSYNVFLDSPAAGPQTIVEGAHPGTSPSQKGWLYPEQNTRQFLQGNNVSAFLDSNLNYIRDCCTTPVLGQQDFLYTENLNYQPDYFMNRRVAATNLFYLNNRVHDILYIHGFTETEGNFQDQNFGNWKFGLGQDSVFAVAHAGSYLLFYRDNSSFATPPDGYHPRMNMFLFDDQLFGGGDARVYVSSPSTAIYAYHAAFGPSPWVMPLPPPTGNLSNQTDTQAIGSTATAEMVVATPADGCSAITPGVAGKIAIIDRGTCFFQIKAINAANAGAIGVIIVDNRAESLFQMVGAGNLPVTSPGIPSVLVSQTDGNMLKALVAPKGRLAATLLRDAALDSGTVYHEYGHGLTWRMIGDMWGPIAGAIGEGASDTVAMLINGADVLAAYSAGIPSGVRRYRYSGYPLTYADVHGAEVHNDGEIFAAVMWRLIESFGSARRDDLFDLFVDAMNYTPSSPTYENMRDGQLQAVAHSNHPADRCTIWAAYAQFGIGVGSSAVINPDFSVTTSPSFVKPADCP